MPLLLTVLRWFGWKAGAFALLALCALAWGGWQALSAHRAQVRITVAEARVSVLEAQRDAAQQLANDYETRAAQAVADSEAATKALAESEKQRRKDWARIRQQEKAWAETKVPESVKEQLR